MKIKIKSPAVIIVVIIIAVFILFKVKAKSNSGEIIKEISPVLGSIRTEISTTGTILPKNRLEIKPQVNGRVESVLVKEGEKVKAGQALAWMSSTERAAILDAARGQGEDKLKYWQEVYKPIALLAPIDGEVIVATTQPGQTVTTNDAVVVLSDHLISRAQVDETDIGKIKLDQAAIISLDAYPDSKIKAKVEHIYYESKTVNNVTIYEVDLIPEENPEFFRSGMNSTVNFIVQNKENVLLLPQEALQKEDGEDYCLVKKGGKGRAQKTAVVLGIADDKDVEIVSGLTLEDKIILKTKKYSLPKSNSGKNPFMPQRRR